MDPTQTLTNAQRAFISGDFRAARDFLRTYAEWRSRGGFEPTGGDFQAAPRDTNALPPGGDEFATRLLALIKQRTRGSLA